MKFTSGVVVAGDRRATEGITIAHRAIEKVFPANRTPQSRSPEPPALRSRWYDCSRPSSSTTRRSKAKSSPLKGRRTSSPGSCASTCRWRCRDSAFCPCSRVADTRRETGRIFTYDLTGGRYEETDFHAVGSGRTNPKNTIKLGFRDDLDRNAAVELAVDALYQAADEDAATGGPDPVRGIYPIIATVDRDGFTKLEDADVAERFASVLQSGQNAAGASRS